MSAVNNDFFDRLLQYTPGFRNSLKPHCTAGIQLPHGLSCHPWSSPGPSLKAFWWPALIKELVRHVSSVHVSPRGSHSALQNCLEAAQSSLAMVAKLASDCRTSRRFVSYISSYPRYCTSLSRLDTAGLILIRLTCTSSVNRQPFYIDCCADTSPLQTAAPGDTVSFKLNPKNHAVTHSSFDAPGTPLYAIGGVGTCSFALFIQIFFTLRIFMSTYIMSFPLHGGLSRQPQAPYREFFVKDVRTSFKFCSPPHDEIQYPFSFSHWIHCRYAESGSDQGMVHVTYR